MKKSFIIAIAAIIACQTGSKIYDWFERKRKKKKIIENIKDEEEEFNNFAEEVKEEKINLRDLDKYSDEKLKRILELTCYFKINKGVENIIDILKKSQEKKKGEK